MSKANKIKLKEEELISMSDIITDDNPLIRQISFDVKYPLNKFETKLMQKMIEYVRSSTNEQIAKQRKLKPAYGISAIQLGYNKKMLFVRVENEFSHEPEEFALINPKVTNRSEKKAYLKTGESCLSVLNDHKGYVVRNYGITIVGIDFFTDREIEINAKGLTAIVLQHEMDHLLGVLYYDRINKLKPFEANSKYVKI